MKWTSLRPSPPDKESIGALKLKKRISELGTQLISRPEELLERLDGRQ